MLKHATYLCQAISKKMSGFVTRVTAQSFCHFSKDLQITNMKVYAQRKFIRVCSKRRAGQVKRDNGPEGFGA